MWKALRRKTGQSGEWYHLRDWVIKSDLIKQISILKHQCSPLSVIQDGMIPGATSEQAHLEHAERQEPGMHATRAGQTMPLPSMSEEQSTICG